MLFQRQLHSDHFQRTHNASVGHRLRFTAANPPLRSVILNAVPPHLTHTHVHIHTQKTPCLLSRSFVFGLLALFPNPKPPVHVAIFSHRAAILEFGADWLPLDVWAAILSGMSGPLSNHYRG